MRRSALRSPLARAIPSLRANPPTALVNRWLPLLPLPIPTPICLRQPTHARHASDKASNQPTIQVATSTEKATPYPPKPSAKPFYFETGLALFAKRPPRPFPPPFLSPPSGSFSDPLSTHHRSRDRRAFVNGELIRGYTNGDDAVYAGSYFVAANDGVGAWSTREGGHAGLWSRLIIHFWALEIESDCLKALDEGKEYTPRPIEYLEKAYEQTIDATSKPQRWQGTTTASGAQLHYGPPKEEDGQPQPVLYVTNLGDSMIMVIRPRKKELVYKTLPQWHWFDCPRQLGTNSPDTPNNNAVTDVITVEENDVVLAVSDGIIDNLWEHEIISTVTQSIEEWEERGDSKNGPAARKFGGDGGMKYVANQLMSAAKVVAQDPFAESPYMEHAIDEGLAMEGGKMDDISVVAALIRRNRELN